MSIGRYEWVKLFHKRLFLVLSVLLVAGNLITFYTYEQHEPRFFYACQQKAQYARFLQGDTSSDIDGYYQWDLADQEAYISTYASFIEEMGDRVERMGQTSLFQDRDSYAYRNLIKSQADFAPLAGLELKADNRFGVQALADYDSGILFLLVFLGMLTYYALFYERDRNLLLLLKGTQKGHGTLAVSKLGTMLIAAAFYTLLQESAMVLLAGQMYGYGDLSRPIQSVYLFRNCARMMTLGEGLLAIIVIRTGVALMLALFLFCVGMALKSESGAVVLSGAILGAEYLLSRALSVSGSLNGIKCVNPFYCWHMRWALWEYLNLDLFGWPVSKEVCTLAIAALLAALFSVTGILAFCKTCQIKAENRLERVMRWLRSKLGFLTRRTSLLYYEFYKMMIQQKKGIVFLLLLVWTVWRIVGVFGIHYYSNAQDAAYQYYMEQLQGPVTEETYTLIENEEIRLNNLWVQMAEADEWEQAMLNAELERLEGGFYAIQMQLEALTEKEGDVSEKYLMNEVAYAQLWHDTDTDIFLWLGGSAAVIFLTGGVYTADEKRQITSLLCSTRNGRRKLDRSRDRSILLTTGAVFLIMELPLFLEYLRIDGFLTVGQRLSDFTNLDFATGLPLAVLLILALLLKAVSFWAVGWLGRRLSRVMKNELLADLAGIGSAAAVAVVLHHFYWDINILLIGLL